MTTTSRKTATTQRGFVLIAALLMLVILTLLGVSMMGSVGLQDKMAGNVREKARATTAASFVVSVVEKLLPTMPLAVSGCTTPTSTWRVCATNTLSPSSAVADSTWGLGGNGSTTNALPATSTTALPSQVFPASLINTNGGSNTYAHSPEFFVEYQGSVPPPPGYRQSPSNPYAPNGAPVVDVYRTTAMATGGNDAAVSVVQSIYSYMHMR